jgi:hypothetical protein
VPAIFSEKQYFYRKMLADFFNTIRRKRPAAGGEPNWGNPRDAQLSVHRSLGLLPYDPRAGWHPASRARHAIKGGPPMRATFIIAAAGVAAMLTIASPAWTQANRTFVSGHGSDSNPCSLGAPCRSFAQALTQTNAGGEITVLDSAGYGTLTINKSITITNPGGVEAGITTTLGETAIYINPSSSIVVTLRGLTLEGGGVGEGITLAATAPGTLNIIDCVVKDFAGIGIGIFPAFSGNTTEMHVLIANSFVLNNAGDGIAISPQSASTFVVYAINHTTVTGNGTSGNDAGILVNSSAGFLSGTISSVYAQMNNIGVNFIGNGVVTFTSIENSVIFLSHNNGGDIFNNSNGLNLYLFDSNQIDEIFNNATINSDGSNNILGVNGNALTLVGRR